MPPTNITDELKSDEGFVGFVYDDANDALIKAGVTVKGNPTVGYGLDLAAEPLTQEEALYLLQNRIHARTASLLKLWPWMSAIGDARFAVFQNMSYQMGVDRFAGFKEMLAASATGDFDLAATYGLDSVWAKEETPARAARLMLRLRTGMWQ